MFRCCPRQMGVALERRMPLYRCSFCIPTRNVDAVDSGDHADPKGVAVEVDGVFYTPLGDAGLSEDGAIIERRKPDVRHQ